MKVGSLCTGYGGYELALAELFDDVELAWYSEFDPGASRVMAHHHSEITNYGDLTTVDWETVPPVDVLTAGFPCQPLSHAGKRKGTEDERWLFDDIAGAIGILRPRLVLLENVTGILTLGGTLVVGSLTRLGYDCRWTVVRASDAGAPHRRARWFCVGTDTAELHRPHRRNSSEGQEGVQAQSGGMGSADPRGGAATRRGNSAAAATTHSQGAERRPEEHAPVDSATGSAAEPGECDRQATADPGSEGLEGHRGEHGLREGGEEAQAEWGDYGAAISRWGAILGRAAPAPADDRGLSPFFVEWMMGLPEGHVTGVELSRADELKMLGNGIVPQQAAIALGLLLGLGENDA